MGIFDFIKKKVEKSVPRQSKVPYVPYVAKTVVKGKINTLNEKLTDLSIIALITGKRGSGKTSLGMKLLEFVHQKTKRNCYILGYKKTKLPRFIKKTDAIEDVPNDSVVLIDEGAITFSARDSLKKSNKYLSNLMAIARHKNLTLFLIVQNSAMIDVNVLRLTDILLLKEPSLLQTKFERKGIKDMYEKAILHFKDVENKKSLFYVFDDDFEGLIEYQLPEFWNVKVSKGFKNF